LVPYWLYWSETQLTRVQRAAAKPELAGHRVGAGGAPARGGALPVAAGEATGAPVRGELQLVQVVDEDVVGGLQLLVAEIPLRRPRELAVAQRAALRHPRRPEVQAACEQRGVQVLLQVAHPRGRAGGVRQPACEAGPLLDLGEQVGDVDARREAIELATQADRGR
jgi:hypothetical protein